jgi:protein FAM50
VKFCTITNNEDNGHISLAAMSSKARARQVAEIAHKKAAIAKRTDDVRAALSAEGFATEVEEHSAAVYGLQTKEQWRAAKEAEAATRDVVASSVAKPEEPALPARAPKRPRPALLSFDPDEADEEESLDLPGSVATSDVAEVPSRVGDPLAEEISGKKLKMMKDPTANAWFLPDAEREQAVAKAAKELEKEWEDAQELVKKEKIAVVYSYWDGSGHRREIEVPKGTTIGKFLEWVRQDLSTEFVELKAVNAESLMFVKEDMIIPPHFSFYDLIVTKARGKTGPLFRFAEDHLRVSHTGLTQREESHPGKVVQRSWYEKNKHMFPATNWEMYDPVVAKAARVA